MDLFGNNPMMQPLVAYAKKKIANKGIKCVLVSTGENPEDNWTTRMFRSPKLLIDPKWMEEIKELSPDLHQRILKLNEEQK